MTSPPAAFRLSLRGRLLVVTLALALSGCGGEEKVATGGGTTRATEAAAPAAAAVGCPKQLHAFVGSLAALRRQLAVGLAYEQYLGRVKGLRLSYDRIPVARLRIDCLSRIGTPGEQALNKHIDAANAWGECLADAACTTAAIEPALQRQWRIASRYLSEAEWRSRRSG